MKNFTILALVVLLFTGCSPSPESIQLAILQTQDAMPSPTTVNTPTFEPSPTTVITPTLSQAAQAESYKVQLGELQGRRAELFIKIADRSSYMITHSLTPSEKDEYREILDELVENAKQMAELPAPTGLEKVQEYLSLGYEETRQFVDAKKAVLIYLTVEGANAVVAHSQKMTEYYDLAWSYFK